MAPRAPTGKAQALSLFDRGKLPIHLGSPHAKVAIVEQDGVFRIRELVADPEEVRAASDTARLKRQSFLPEHVEALAKPTGKIFLEAKTRDELHAPLAEYSWPRDW